MERQTEATRLIVASHNSANALKNKKNSNRRTGRHERKDTIKQTGNVKVTVFREILIRNTAENKDLITGFELKQAPELWNKTVL